MIIRLLLLMILCHILDDFVLQGVCLCDMKQKKWWKQNAPDNLYKNDYKIALLIHSISWSIMITLPAIFFTNIKGWVLLLICIINALIHCFVDNSKANLTKINLCTDQLVHFLQIIITWGIFSILI